MNRRMVIERAERLHQIPPYRHQELTRYKKRLAARGIEPIDLTVGTIEAAGRQDVIEHIIKAIEGSMREILSFKTLAENGLAVLKDASPERRQTLEGMYDMYSFLEREYPALMNRWKEDNQ